ncbi:hypothetical protein [Bradyrhizobium sp. HKCCYLR20261]|uniref:hypothetical protein n=1 Tax=Bradyrhizobium sp. HKCCYLR20261 TaxID=3420760 RepID=UPI003EBD2413
MTQSALPSHGHSHAHDAHGHGHGHGHNHGHAHSHGPAAPHPAQPAPWSILRMPVTVRLGAALAASAVLWVIVILAMR